MTEEEKTDGKSLTVEGNLNTGETYSVTVTPTSDWYMLDPDIGFLGKGEPYTVTADVNDGKIELPGITAAETNTQSEDQKFIALSITVIKDR